MSVGRVCIREVDTAQEHESALVAARRMHDRKVGTLVVVDDKSAPIGLLTDRDLTVRVLAAARDPSGTKVADVMTSSPKTVREDAALEDALRIMRAAKCRRIPVVSAENRLSGLISLDDVLQLLAEEFLEIGGLLEQESPRSLGR